MSVQDFINYLNENSVGFFTMLGWLMGFSTISAIDYLFDCIHSIINEKSNKNKKNGDDKK